MTDVSPRENVKQKESCAKGGPQSKILGNVVGRDLLDLQEIGSTFVILCHS